MGFLTYSSVLNEPTVKNANISVSSRITSSMEY